MMTEKFLKAIPKTLSFEGGYAHDPDDPGGETKFGICKRTYPALDIAGLNREQAIAIYWRDWWVKYGYDRIDDADVAAKVFDMAVNMGPSQAHKLVQRAAGGLVDDGILGPLSVARINECEPGDLLDGIRAQAEPYYRNLADRKPRMKKYLNGWLRRARS